MTNLFKKMHAVMCESEGIEKIMTVGKGAFAYKAVSEKTVLNEIKPLLKKHGLILFPIEITKKRDIDTVILTTTTKEKEKEIVEEKKSTSVFTDISVKYKIVDIDSGEYEILETTGDGVDPQDKGSGKAMTYAYKILLQKTFCLFSGEDTDNTHSDDLGVRVTKENAPPKPKPKQEVKGYPTPSEAQIKKLYAISNSRGFSEAQIKTAIIKELNKQSVNELTITEYDQLVKRIEAKPPVEKEM